MKIDPKRDSTNAAVGFSAIFYTLKTAISIQVINIFFTDGVFQAVSSCVCAFSVETWAATILWALACCSVVRNVGVVFLYGGETGVFVVGAEKV